MTISYYWSKLLKRIQGKSIRGSKIDSKAYINYGSNIVNSSMGKYSYCGYDCWIIEADIGRFCSISNGVHIGGPSHPMDWISTSPVFHKGGNVLKTNISELNYDPYKRTSIGNDVWIGENAMIKSGIKIGDGAVVGMGSIITHDVPPYEVWAGNPAKKIRSRFSEDQTEKIAATKWWALSDKQLKNAPSVSKIDEFISYIKGMN